MLQIICGNIVALLASILMVYSGLAKNNKKIIYIQTIQIICFAISDLILGGITGTIINIISIARNILCYKNKLTPINKGIIIIVSIIFSLLFNNLGLLGLLPLVSTVTYTLFMNIKSTIRLKLLIIFTMAMWLIYDVLILSYTSAVFDFFSILANVITIYQLSKTRKN